MTKCRIYDTPCINPRYCDERDACCAGDMNCKPELPMTLELLKSILSEIKIFDRNFEITNVWTGEAPTDRCGWHLQVTYWEKDIHTGKDELQKSRKWLISKEDTETDVVATVFAAVMRSYDHVVQEHFTYKGKRVFSPHFDIGARLQMAGEV